jgi:hypothetical protein
MKIELSTKEVQLLCDSLEELYDNLQYENISDSELRKQQIAISKLVAKLLEDEMAIGLLEKENV